MALGSLGAGSLGLVGPAGEQSPEVAELDDGELEAKTWKLVADNRGHETPWWTKWGISGLNSWIAMGQGLRMDSSMLRLLRQLPRLKIYMGVEKSDNNKCSIVNTVTIYQNLNIISTF